MNMIQKMKEIVEENVQYYQEDFDLDKKILKDSQEEYFLWIVRKHGTYLFPLVNVLEKMSFSNTAASYYLKEGEYYLLKKNKFLKKVPAQKVKKALGYAVSGIASYLFEDGTVLPKDLPPVYYEGHGSATVFMNVDKEKVQQAMKQVLNFL